MGQTQHFLGSLGFLCGPRGPRSPKGPRNPPQGLQGEPGVQGAQEAQGHYPWCPVALMVLRALKGLAVLSVRPVDSTRTVAQQDAGKVVRSLLEEIIIPLVSGVAVQICTRAAVTVPKHADDRIRYVAVSILYP